MSNATATDLRFDLKLAPGYLEVVAATLNLLAKQRRVAIPYSVKHLPGLV